MGQTIKQFLGQQTRGVVSRLLRLPVKERGSDDLLRTFAREEWRRIKVLAEEKSHELTREQWEQFLGEVLARGGFDLIQQGSLDLGLTREEIEEGIERLRLGIGEEQA